MDDLELYLLTVSIVSEKYPDRWVDRISLEGQMRFYMQVAEDYKMFYRNKVYYNEGPHSKQQYS